MLELMELCKRYESQPDEADYVLRDISWQVAGGRSVAVVGPSGSGKSTLLNIIGTLDRPTRGKVWLDKKDLTALKEKEFAALRNREIGFVFQLHHLLPQCTVLENVLIPTLAIESDRDSSASSKGDTDPIRRAQDLLERVGLSQRLHYRPGQLSGGERQRVAMVRALINQPKLLLADEPTGSLDRAAAQVLADLMIELNREQQVTLIIATHSMELADRMEQVWELNNGTLTLRN